MIPPVSISRELHKGALFLLWHIYLCGCGESLLEQASNLYLRRRCLQIRFQRIHAHNRIFRISKLHRPCTTDVYNLFSRFGMIGIIAVVIHRLITEQEKEEQDRPLHPLPSFPFSDHLQDKQEQEPQKRCRPAHQAPCKLKQIKKCRDQWKMLLDPCIREEAGIKEDGQRRQTKGNEQKSPLFLSPVFSP